MPIVVNSNASASSASLNLSRANDVLTESLLKLSSGNRIKNPVDDAGGLVVTYKLNTKENRASVILQNTQNAFPYLQLQDRNLQILCKIVDRISELKVMSLDLAKNSQDVGNYSKEFKSAHHRIINADKAGMSTRYPRQAYAVRPTGFLSTNRSIHDDRTRELIYKYCPPIIGLKNIPTKISTLSQDVNNK